MGLGYPALKRWATIKRPYGTKNFNHPPRFDSRQRPVSQVQQSPGTRDNVPILHLKIDPTDIDAALTDLEDDRVLACGILLQHRLFHEGVRVAAGDEVDAAHLRGDLRIADFVVPRIRVIAKMRHADNQLTLLLF